MALIILFIIYFISFGSNNIDAAPQMAAPPKFPEEPGCKTECVPTADGKGRKCTTACTEIVPTAGRTTGMLDKACVEACNGGPIAKLEDLKPECEQKCAWNGQQQQQQAALTKTEFSTMESCLQYCKQKDLGKSEAECHDKCKQSEKCVMITG